MATKAPAYRPGAGGGVSWGQVVPPGGSEITDEDDEFARTSAAHRFGAAQLDLTRLEPGSLQRYQQAYHLSESPGAPGGGRDELLTGIARHLAALYVDEDETLIRFAIACRRAGQRVSLAGVTKRPGRGGFRPRGR